MKFLGKKIGESVLKEMEGAKEARIAVAFFSPDENMRIALNKIPDLKLVISEEFTVNNPAKLEELGNNALIRSVPLYADAGKLHAKVFIIKRSDNSFCVLLGSANLTWRGMFDNQETCVALDSNDAADRKSIREIEDWFEALFESARQPDLDQARAIFENRSRYRFTRGPTSHEEARGAGYWVLKTTSGTSGEDFWPAFLAQDAVKIGWSDIAGDPSRMSAKELRNAIGKAYPHHTDMQTSKTAAKIEKFVSMKKGDLVLICRGYNTQHDKPVHIYGFARIDGPFYLGPPRKGDWRFNHRAIIQDVDITIPKNVLADALNMKSLQEAIHELEPNGFVRLMEKLDELGARVRV